MNQTGFDHASRQRHAQRSPRKFIFESAVQIPADHAARVSVRDHGQEYKLLAQLGLR